MLVNAKKCGECHNDCVKQIHHTAELIGCPKYVFDSTKKEVKKEPVRFVKNVFSQK